MPKLLFDLFIAQIHQREDFVLDLGHVDTDTATANLIAIADDVVLFSANMQGVGIEAINMRFVHAGKWVVFSLKALALLVEMEQGEINHPTQSHLIGVNQLQTFSQFDTQAEEDIVADLGAIGDKQQKIAGLALKTLNNGLDLVGRQKFGHR